MTFSGTITGTVPSGTTAIFYRLIVGYDGGGGGDTAPGTYEEILSGTTPVTTLPADYSSQVSFSYYLGATGYTGAGVNLQVWFAQNYEDEETGTSYEVRCGCLEGTCASPPATTCGAGGPSITTTSVTCNLDTSGLTGSTGAGMDTCY